MSIKRLILLLISLALFLYLPLNALAFDEEYLSDPAKFYNNSESVQLEYNTVSGFIEYTFDKNNADAYYHVYLLDTNLTNADADSVSFQIEIANELNTYSFRINRNGLTEDNKLITDSFDIYCNFKTIETNYGVLEVYFGFHFKNKKDRVLYNALDLYYFSGQDTYEKFLSGIDLDMYVPPKTKSTTQRTTRQTTTRQTKTQRSKTTTANRTISVKSSKAAETKPETSKSSATITTKFVPTFTVFNGTKTNVTQTTKLKTDRSNKQSTTAFSANKTEKVKQTETNASSTEYIDENDDYFSTYTTAYNPINDMPVTKSKLSPQAKAMLTVGIVLASISIIAIIITKLSEGYSIVKKSDNDK